MSTPTITQCPKFAWCVQGHDHKGQCSSTPYTLIEEPEGVAAPLEPSAEQVFNFCAEPDNPPYLCIQKINEFAAAVSKNLTDKYAEMEAKWIRELLTVSEEIGTARAELVRIKKLFHDLTPGGSEFYNDPDYCADYLRKRSQSQHEIAVKSIKRAKELEKEITALREKP